jgi:hypothetical protein
VSYTTSGKTYLGDQFRVDLPIFVEFECQVGGARLANKHWANIKSTTLNKNLLSNSSILGPALARNDIK